MLTSDGKYSFSGSGPCFGDSTPLTSCYKNIIGHLRYQKVGMFSNSTDIDLLRYRSEYFDVELWSCRRLLLVCCSHRDSLGIYWKQPIIKCCYPLHKGKCKLTKQWQFLGKHFSYSKKLFKLEVVNISAPFCFLLKVKVTGNIRDYNWWCFNMNDKFSKGRKTTNSYKDVTICSWSTIKFYL